MHNFTSISACTIGIILGYTLPYKELHAVIQRYNSNCMMELQEQKGHSDPSFYSLKLFVACKLLMKCLTHNQ